MSTLTATPQPCTLHCRGCGRRYPTGDGVTVTLRRADDLATRPQDLVVHRHPDQPQADYLTEVAGVLRRERFLATLSPAESFTHTTLAPIERLATALPPRSTVLDASGQGTAAAPLAAHGHRVVALIDAPSAQDPAGGITGPEAITSLQADPLEMPFASAAFDGVWGGHLLARLRVDRHSVFFRQVHRILCPGGVLALEAATTAIGTLVRHYAWQRLRGRPVVFGEAIDPRRRYTAYTTAHTLDSLCHAHGLRVQALRRYPQASGAVALFLLAQKTASEGDDAKTRP